MGLTKGLRGLPAAFELPGLKDIFLFQVFILRFYFQVTF